MFSVATTRFANKSMGSLGSLPARVLAARVSVVASFTFQLTRLLSHMVCVGETIKNSTATLIHNRERRMARSMEQFSWSPGPCLLLTEVVQTEPWSVSFEPPSKIEARNAITALSGFRAASPDPLAFAPFKFGGEVLYKPLTHLFEHVWKEEAIPSNYSESIITTIYKRCTLTECANDRALV